MKQAIAYTFDGVTSCQWLSDDEARIIQQNDDISIRTYIGFSLDEAAVMVREHYEGGLLTIEFLPDPDPNAAMIARDEPIGDHTPGETWGFRIDNRQFKWPGGEIVKSTAKPAITGLTTVHDGKVSGLGFCSDLGHE